MRILALVLLILAGCGHTPELPVYGIVPEFSLTGPGSQPVTRRELEGKVWVADFIFTHCAGTCPDMTATMRKLQEKLPREVHFLSFTVDPERDTTEVLAEYSRVNGADPGRWMFLTGEREAMYRLCREGFKMAVDDTQGTEAEPITHSTRFVLIDGLGQIRGYYGLEDKGTPDAIAAAVRKLL